MLVLLRLLVGAQLAAAGAGQMTLCAAFPGVCDGSFAGGAIVVESNATVGGTLPTEMGQLAGLQEMRLLRCRLSVDKDRSGAVSIPGLTIDLRALRDERC